jgi:hypothetical protein
LRHSLAHPAGGDRIWEVLRGMTSKKMIRLGAFADEPPAQLHKRVKQPLRHAQPAREHRSLIEKKELPVLKPKCDQTPLETLYIG